MNVVRCACITTINYGEERREVVTFFFGKDYLVRNGTGACYVVSSAWPYCSFVSLHTADGRAISAS
jgi:hypothetical protein